MVFAVTAEKEKSNAVIGFDNGGGGRCCKHVVFRAKIPEERKDGGDERVGGWWTDNTFTGVHLARHAWFCQLWK